MTEFRARIGRVRMKNGGADVLILPAKPNGDDEISWRGALVRAAKMVAENDHSGELAGYFIAGIFSDGATSTGFRYDPERCPIPRALMPAWIEEIVRRDMVTAVEADGVFNEKFEWVER